MHFAEGYKKHLSVDSRISTHYKRSFEKEPVVKGQLQKILQGWIFFVAWTSQKYYINTFLKNVHPFGHMWPRPSGLSVRGEFLVPGLYNFDTFECKQKMEINPP